MPADVAKWLQALGLDKYVDVFVENDVDLRALPELTGDDLRELGVSVGHRRVLLKAIATLSESVEGSSEHPAQKSVPDPSLAAWERHPGERKPVTMLFADVTGFTALDMQLAIVD